MVKLSGLTPGPHVVLLELTQLLRAPALPDAHEHGKNQCEPALCIPQLWNHLCAAPLLCKRTLRKMRRPHIRLVTGWDLEMVQTRLTLVAETPTGFGYRS